MAQPTCAEARAREASGTPVTAARSPAAPRLRRSERICGSSQHSPPHKKPSQPGREGRGLESLGAGLEGPGAEPEGGTWGGLGDPETFRPQHAGGHL